MQELIDYYVNLLIIQYNNKPKARATIEAVVRAALAGNVFFDVRDGYDIDDAVGAQLDVIGKYEGIDRFYYNFELVDDYFGFADAADIAGTSDNIVGFDDASSSDKFGDFLNAVDVISSTVVLNDDAYRTLIKLRTLQNYSNHSFGDIAETVFEIFGGDVLVKDNYDMTMTYFVQSNRSEVVNAAIQKDVLPRPSAVGSQVIEGNEFFGFADADNLDAIPDYIVGLDDSEVLDKQGRFLNSNSDIL